MSRFTEPDLWAARSIREGQQALDAESTPDDEPTKTPAQRAQFEAHLERLIAAAGATA